MAKDVVLVGVSTRVEIWSQTLWSDYSSQAEDLMSMLPSLWLTWEFRKERNDFEFEHVTVLLKRQ